MSDITITGWQHARLVQDSSKVTVARRTLHVILFHLIPVIDFISRIDHIHTILWFYHNYSLQLFFQFQSCHDIYYIIIIVIIICCIAIAMQDDNATVCTVIIITAIWSIRQISLNSYNYHNWVFLAETTMQCTQSSYRVETSHFRKY